MPFVIVRHKVNSFPAWREGFDRAEEFRKESGEKVFRIYTNHDDPEEVIAMFHWDTIDNAKAFFGSSKLMEKMKEAGVADKPDIYFLDEQ